MWPWRYFGVLERRRYLDACLYSGHSRHYTGVVVAMHGPKCNYISAKTDPAALDTNGAMMPLERREEGALSPPATAGQPPLRTVYCQIALGSNERTLDFHACPSALALCCPHLQWGPSPSQVSRYFSARSLPAFSVFCSSSSVVIRYTAFGGPFASVDLPHPYEWNLHTAWLCL